MNACWLKCGTISLCSLLPLTTTLLTHDRYEEEEEEEEEEEAFTH